MVKKLIRYKLVHLSQYPVHSSKAILLKKDFLVSLPTGLLHDKVADSLKLNGGHHSMIGGRPIPYVRSHVDL